MSSTLLLVYDAEDLRCRRLVDWIGNRDRDGLVVSFPYQNGELVRVAPELAGLEYTRQIYTLDTETREVRDGRGILPGVLKRLPGWGWVQGPAGIGWIAKLLLIIFSR